MIEIMLQVSITAIFNVRIRYHSRIKYMRSIHLSSLPFPPQRYIVNILGIYTT